MLVVVTAEPAVVVVVAVAVILTAGLLVVVVVVALVVLATSASITLLFSLESHCGGNNILPTFFELIDVAYQRAIFPHNFRLLL